jgi:adenosylcobyric acid synthase
MFQGTGSNVGKSLIVAGLCRVLANRGLNVMPFKPQNMSNNAAVTPEGGEIGRAQALQARAARVEPSVHMNPVLLKPQADNCSQLIVQGKVRGTFKGENFRLKKKKLLEEVMASFHSLQENAAFLIVEGAGSPAEINLRRGDIANMGFALAANVPVILIGDIDRGGVIASIVGTHAVLPPSERNQIKGFIINKFRGDLDLFDEGIEFIAKKTGWPCLGVVPHIAAARSLPAEDGVELDQSAPASNLGAIKIAVPRIPSIANFDDLDPLEGEPDVCLEYVHPASPLPGNADLILLPGSKATIADLEFFRDQGWQVDLEAHLRRGGRVMGLCGGYQMLGIKIDDREGIEGPPRSVAGLGLLDVETTLLPEKSLRRVEGQSIAGGHSISGYEIHCGKTAGADCARPVLSVNGKPHGASSANGLVQGVYVHGLFESDGFRDAFLREISPQARVRVNNERRLEEALDAVAAMLEASVDIDKLLELGG